MDADLARLKNVVTQVAHPGFLFQVTLEGGHYFLRIHSQSRCNTTGVWMQWAGRKWRLSPYMTDGEVVQTAFLASIQAAEHEHREQFTYKGAAVFDPHYDIDKLVELRKSADALKERA